MKCEMYWLNLHWCILIVLIVYGLAQHIVNIMHLSTTIIKKLILLSSNVDPVSFAYLQEVLDIVLVTSVKVILKVGYDQINISYRNVLLKNISNPSKISSTQNHCKIKGYKWPLVARKTKPISDLWKLTIGIILGC